MKTRNQALEEIAKNIRDHRYHVYIVSGGPTPRWAYTIGLTPKTGFELAFAGGAIFLKDDVLEILHHIVNQINRNELLPSIEVPKRGSFRLSPVCQEWSARLLLGAIDYHQKGVECRQVVPDDAHKSIDVPDLSTPLVRGAATPWRWLDEPWPYAVSAKSEAMTNLKALMGVRVTEGARWEDDYWEVFSGSGEEVSREEGRLVPLGTLLGADPSLEALTRLDVGTAMWRKEDGDWHPWRAS